MARLWWLCIGAAIKSVKLYESRDYIKKKQNKRIGNKGEVMRKVRSKKEIENKIEELYKLLNEGKLSTLWVILTTDALSWALGEDYLDTEIILGGEIND